VGEMGEMGAVGGAGAGARTTWTRCQEV